MKITYQDFISYIDKGDLQNLNKIRNFYYTFGYLILADGISNTEIDLLKSRVLSMSEKLLEKDSRNRPIVNKTVIMHKALEGDAGTLEWFVNQNQYLRIVRFLLGENAAFFVLMQIYLFMRHHGTGMLLRCYQPLSFLSTYKIQITLMAPVILLSYLDHIG